jgi:hypothetical protein
MPEFQRLYGTEARCEAATEKVAAPGPQLHILDPQAERLHEPQASAIQQLGHLGLVLGGGAHPLLCRHMAQEGIDLRLLHLARIAHLVEPQKPS